MNGHDLPARMLTAFQVASLAVFVGMLVSPIDLPDPLALGSRWSLTAISFAVAIAVWIPELLAGRWPRTRLDKILGAYLLVTGLSAIASVNRSETLRAILALAGNVATFYVTVAIVRKRSRSAEELLCVLVAGIALVELIALGYHVEFGLATRPAYYPVPRGWAGYPELGALAVLQAGFVIAGLLVASGIPAIAAAALSAAIGASEAVLFYSRTALVASAVVLASALLLWRGHVRRLVTAYLVIVGLIGVLVMTDPTMRYVAGSLVGRIGVAPQGVNLAPSDMRFELWRRTMALISDYPLTGVGLGNYRQIFETDYNPELNNDQRRGAHAHNLWLHQMAEVGVIGGACYAALWAMVLWIAWRSARRAPGFVTIGVFLALAGTTGSNLTDNVPFLVGGARLYAITWILFGLIAAVDPEATKSPRPEPVTAFFESV